MSAWILCFRGVFSQNRKGRFCEPCAGWRLPGKNAAGLFAGSRARKGEMKAKQRRFD
jgi:hypothetical protein